MIKKIPGGFSLGNYILYNYLYSNDLDRIGIILKIKEDVNFAYMVTILTESATIEMIPYNVMEYNVLWLLYCV